jgi:hypothetical protein
LWAALLPAACGTPTPQPDAQHGAVPTLPGGRSGVDRAAAFPPGDPAPGPGVFRIDTARSSLRLLVYRAGAMARLGHNHVISQGKLDGWVKYSGSVTDAALLLRVPVGDFVVDDAALRGEEGPDFAADVPEDAKGGTKHNMLSEALLDAGHFPSLTLRSLAVKRDPPGASGGTVTATLAVSVAGHASTLVVPFVLVDEGRVLRAVGSVKLRQSALGLVPFSVMLGALQVQDEFTVKFELLAAAT